MPYADKIAAVYRIVNKATGVCYVGQSQNVYKRLREHFRLLREKKHDNKWLQRAYQKHGPDAFSQEIEVLCADVNDLDVVEEAFLSGAAWFDETPRTYNLAKFARAPMRGKRHSEEVRARIRAGRRATAFDYKSPQYKQRLREAQQKRLFSDPAFVARIRFLVENPDMSYAERGRVLGIETSTARKQALKYAHLKGKL
jgi:group I intron endonuclease